MRTLKAFLKAVIAFLKELTRPRDKVEKFCSKGHSLLQGWEYCPNCKILSSWKSFKYEKAQKKVKGWIYGIKGKHRGEIFEFKEDFESLGPQASCLRVVTPGEQESYSPYHVLFSDKTEVSSQGEVVLGLNRQTLRKTEVMDYDEIQLSGNTFLYLETPTQEGA